MERREAGEVGRVKSSSKASPKVSDRWAVERRQAQGHGMRPEEAAESPAHGNVRFPRTRSDSHTLYARNPTPLPLLPQANSAPPGRLGYSSHATLFQKILPGNLYSQC